jgi:DNA-binding LacI/PurR family transcriptional regulator
MPVRLADVARAAGVSASTVSRVFSDPDRISAETVDTVKRVAGELGFQRKALPRTAKSIDLLVQDLANPLFGSLLASIERQARTAGYTVTVGVAEESAAMERQHVSRVLDSVSGLILHPRGLSDGELRELAAQRPVVLFNREAEGVSSVVVDTQDGSRQIIDHLVSLGHRRVVYVAGPDGSWSERSRWGALEQAASAQGIELVRVGPFLPTVSQGGAAAELAWSKRPTAIIAFNDQIAMGLMRRLQHLGVDIPSQVSVVGYDDTFGSDFYQPALTTIHAPIEQAGRLAMDVLLSLIDGGPPGLHRVAGTLVVRDSTTAAR